MLALGGKFLNACKDQLAHPWDIKVRKSLCDDTQSLLASKSMSPLPDPAGAPSSEFPRNLSTQPPHRVARATAMLVVWGNDEGTLHVQVSFAGEHQNTNGRDMQGREPPIPPAPADSSSLLLSLFLLANKTCTAWWASLTFHLESGSGPLNHSGRCPLFINLNGYGNPGPCLGMAWADTDKPVH